MKYRYSAEDLSLYYSDTYMMYQDAVVYIARVMWDRGRISEENPYPIMVEVRHVVAGNFANAVVVTLKHADLFMDTFFPLPRQEGFVNVGAFCTHIARYARREAKKGFHWGGYDVQHVPYEMHYAFNEFGDMTRLLVVQGLAGRGQTLGFRECIRSVFTKERFAASWHRNWCVALNTDQPLPLIYYKTNPVAFVLDADARDIIFHREADLLLDAYEESKQ